MAITFAALREGDLLPVQERTPTHALVLATMGGVFGPGTPRQFFDPEYARGIGLGGTIVPAPVKWNYLEQYLRRWLGGGGVIRRLQVSHRRPNLQEHPMILRASVVRKYEEHGQRLADFELFIDTPEGDRAVRAAATVAFPAG